MFISHFSHFVSTEAKSVDKIPPKVYEKYILKERNNSQCNKLPYMNNPPDEKERGIGN
jgi:hypothetical protein